MTARSRAKVRAKRCTQTLCPFHGNCKFKLDLSKCRMAFDADDDSIVERID